MPNVGPLELIIVLVIVLLIFGPKRLPGLGRSLGSSMREFKDSLGGKPGPETHEGEAEVESRQLAAPPPGAAAKPEAETPAAVERDAAGERRG